MLSLILTPVASSDGLLELNVGAEVSTTTDKAEEDELSLPAASVAVTVISCVPSERVPVMI